jgi:N-acylneuraminate cytidylyltransferase
MCPEIDRCVVSTDSESIAELARSHGGDVPFLRPAQLAQDDTPMIPVLQHVLMEMEAHDKRRYESVLLLQPTSPSRLPEDVTRAAAMLEEDPTCVGVVGVSEPGFKLRWNCYEERDGYLASALPQHNVYTRRQDVPPLYRVNGALYLWRRDYLLEAPLDPTATNAPHKMLIMLDERCLDIDSLRDFRLAEILIREAFVALPWLETDA